VTRVARRTRNNPPIHAITDLDLLLPQADVVFLTAPHTPETNGMIGARQLGLLPEGALLVNIGRGRLIDTDALLVELHHRRIHAALDVVDPEPLPRAHPLWGAPNLIISPHVGGNSTAFAPRADQLIGDQLRRHINGDPLHNMVRPGLDAVTQ
jgi:phosphoglycerate dehydrogenase-like enzyme